MDDQEFMKQEYLSLREEIRETKGRIFKTMGFGLIVVPGSYVLGEAHKIDSIILALPILVIVVALIYLAENNALMRCGRYIKHHIESKMARIVGWESWLETEGKGNWDLRNVDRYLSYAFYLLFIVYFIGSVFLASRFAISSYGFIVGSVLWSVYAAIGICFVIYLIASIRVSTATATDSVDAS